MLHRYKQNKFNFAKLTTVFAKLFVFNFQGAAKIAMLVLAALLVILPGCMSQQDQIRQTMHNKKKNKKSYIPEKYLKWQKGLDLSRKKARDPLYNRFVAEGGMAIKEEDQDDPMHNNEDDSGFKQSMNQKIRSAISD